METIGLIISFFKLIFNKGFKESLLYAIEQIKDSEDWEKDMKLFKGKFKNYEALKTEILLGHIEQTLNQKYWDQESIENLKIIYRELVTNAINHGIPNDSNGLVRVEANVATQFAQLKISDTGTGFDLRNELKKRGKLSEVQNQLHGLTLVYRIASNLTQYHDGSKNIVVTIYRQGQQPIEINRDSQFVIIKFKGNLFSNSSEYIKRLQLLEEIKENEKLIIQFGENTNFNQTIFIRSVVDPISKVSISDEQGKSENIVIVGGENIHTILREYLRTKFEIFDSLIEAKTYLKIRN